MSELPRRRSHQRGGGRPRPAGPSRSSRRPARTLTPIGFIFIGFVFIGFIFIGFISIGFIFIGFILFGFLGRSAWCIFATSIFVASSSTVDGTLLPLFGFDRAEAQGGCHQHVESSGSLSIDR